jgi:hypothetical protein
MFAQRPRQSDKSNNTPEAGRHENWNEEGSDGNVKQMDF